MKGGSVFAFLTKINIDIVHALRYTLPNIYPTHIIGDVNAWRSWTQGK